MIRHEINEVIEPAGSRKLEARTVEKASAAPPATTRIIEERCAAEAVSE